MTGVRAARRQETIFPVDSRQTRRVVQVRIGGPARKHGVTDADIRHAAA